MIRFALPPKKPTKESNLARPAHPRAQGAYKHQNHPPPFRSPLACVNTAQLHCLWMWKGLILMLSYFYCILLNFDAICIDRAGPLAVHYRSAFQEETLKMLSLMAFPASYTILINLKKKKQNCQYYQDFFFNKHCISIGLRTFKKEKISFRWKKYECQDLAKYSLVFFLE